MQHHTPSHDEARQIEAQLDHDRAALSQSLHALRRQFSLDSVWSGGAALIKANAAPYSQAIDTAVRANPAALALTSVGLAWLILGQRSPNPKADPSSLAGTLFEAEARWEDEGGPVSDLAPSDAQWLDDAERLSLRASGMIARINTAVREGRIPAADLAKSRSDVVTSLAKDLRRVMSQGLETMGESARYTALAARERAYAARVEAGKLGKKVVRDRPLSAAFALVAAGAAVGALLPQSDAENKVLSMPGAQLILGAKRILSQERQRIAGSVHRLSQSLKADLAGSDKL